MVNLTDFLKYVRPDAPNAPDLILTDAVRRACIQFCERTELIEESVDFNTVAGQAGYAVTPSAGFNTHKLRTVLREDVDLAKSNKVDAPRGSGTPTHFYLEKGGNLILARTPDAVETLTQAIIVKPERIVTAVSDVLYDDYAETIAAGALSIVLRMAKFLNADLQRVNQDLFDSVCHDARMDVEKGHVSGGTLVTAPCTFGGRMT